MKTRNLLMVSIILALVFIVFTLNVKAQNIGINSTGATPNSSAMLDIDVSAMAAKKGLLIPRVALTSALDVTTISSPAISLLIYNTATNGVSPNNVVPGYYFWNGSLWLQLLSNGGSSGIWSRSSPYVFLTTNTDNVGIGTTMPNFKLDILKNTTVSHDRALNIEFNSNAVTTTAPLHGDSSAALFIRTRGTSTGDIYSGYFNTSSNSTGYSAGLINYVNGTGTGTKIGIAEMIFGNGDKAGFSANISGTGTSHYGAYYDVSGASTNYGLYAKVDGSNDYGIFIEGNPMYSAYFSGGVCYVKDIVSIGYPTGLFNNTYTLDVNGKSNFTNALLFNGLAGVSGNVLQSNGSASAPSWVSLASVGLFWEQDANGDIFNNNTWGKVDVTSPNSKNTTDVFLNLFRVKSNDLANPLALQMGIKTDFNSTNRYGAIEVDDGGTVINLILQPNMGNVGIGTISPSATLEIKGATDFGSSMLTTNASGTKLIDFRKTNGGNAGAIDLYNLGTRKVLISSMSQSFFDAGFFGIGITTPNAMLEVSVSGGLQDILMLSSSDGLNGDRFIVKSSGNVGIGNNNPSEKLHIVGNVRISSLATGIKIVQADANGTLVPMSAGLASEVLLGTGIWGPVPGTGNNWLLTGNTGTIDGTNYIGTSDNVALNFRVWGTKAGRIDPVGPVFLGFKAGELNAGIYNTGIGFHVLKSNTTGNFNTALGNSVLLNNITGISNTAIGYGSLSINTIGSYNSSLGQNAGITSTGSNNIFIGYLSGENLTSGDKNIIIGTDIDAPIATGSNQLNIGNIIFGTGVTGINGVYGNGNIGIGNTSPSYKLDVTGNARLTSTLTIGAYTLPAIDGTSGQVLRTNGAGALTWQTLAGLGTAWGLSGNASTVAGTNYIGTTDAIDLVFKTNSTEWMRILSGGNIGIGIVAPSQKLHVLGSVYAESGGYKVFNTTNDLYRSSTGKYGGTISYDFNNVSTQAGIVLENGETESGGFYADGDMVGIWAPGDNDLLKIWDEDGMILRARVDGLGNWYAVSNNATSDVRLKKNIRPLNGSLNKILALNGKLFDWKEEILFKGELEAGKVVPYDELKNKIGFMAQDLELILPEVVSTNKNSGYKAVNYEAIIPVVTEAIKEQQKQIEDLKAIVAEQQKQINQLLNH